MSTDSKARSIDAGLPVLYDGDRNELLYEGETLKYPAGAMIAEYARMYGPDIKQVIMECGHLTDKPTRENLSLFFKDFQDKMQDRFEPVAGSMAGIEIFNEVEEWVKAEEAGCGKEYLDNLRKQDLSEEIRKFIFEDTEYDGIGNETVCQMLLSAYASYTSILVYTKYTFNNLVKLCFTETKEDVDQKAVDLLGSLFTEYTSWQKIEYRILNIEGRFRSFYNIKSSMSLLAFEFAHWLDKDVPFVKCANCGRYFVPDGRVDQIYCSYSSPQNKEKTCRELGAQIARRNKEKNDAVTREYRKIYMRYKMTTKRHPESREARQKLGSLTQEVAGWRKKLADGSATTEQFMEWLGQF